MSGSAPLRGTSTNLNPNYLFSQFVPTITVQESNGAKINVLEVFSTRMGRAIGALRPAALERYVNKPIPTIAYQRFGHTTAWWMIMLASQELHALAVENGKLLTIPDIDAIRRSLDRQFTNGARIPLYVTI